MSYTRVRPRNSKRNKRLKQNYGNDCKDCCPIPISQLKTFVEENPNATESAQIEAFLGQTMIKVFNENQPNLVNTSPKKMADYKRQRSLVQTIDAIKREQKKANVGHKSSGYHLNSYISEPFFTCLIIVKSNHKPSTDDYFYNLRQFGKIKDIVPFEDKYESHSAFVRFESSDVASDLCYSSTPIRFNYGLAKNVSVMVFGKRVLSSDAGYHLWAFMRPIHKQVLVERVRNCLPFGTHFEEMKQILLVSDNDRHNRFLLCQKLETILNDNKILCEFHIFGSTVNRLGFCDSDIDVFIYLLEENNLTAKMDSNRAIIYLARIREVLGRELKMYIRPTVESKRCPLIKLDFRQFSDCLRVNGISVDISLNNSLGIQNSKLIAFYCKLEPRFQTLAVVLRYLAKLNGFIGSSQMSSYAFSMLIIFFCQSLTVPLLPTVDELMRIRTKSVEINGIQCGFCDDVRQYRHIFPYEWKETSINCLFEMFFQFYEKFDFRSRVICPRSGTSVLKSKFDKYLERYHVTNVHEFKLTELICIQDPFDLTFNMSHHMPYKLFLHLRSWFMKGSANSHEYFSEVVAKDDNQKTFIDLLDPTIESIETIKQQLNPQKRQQSQHMSRDTDSEVVVVEDNDEEEVEIIGGSISRHLITKLVTHFGSDITAEEVDNQMDDWALKVGHFFRMLFRSAFNEMNCIYGSQTKSKIKLNESTTFDSFVVKFQTTDRRVIDCELRKAAEAQMKLIPNDVDFIRRQTLITDTIIKDSENCLIIDDNCCDLRLEVELCLESNNQIVLNVSDIKPRNATQVVTQLTQDLIGFICYTFRKGLEAEKLLAIDDDIIYL